MNAAVDQDLDRLLKQKFGFDKFRKGQREAIQALMEKGRVLCIQPTGYGKSLLYQLPALLLPGMTVVISPLLALMRDQISHLRERFNIAAGALNTDQDDDENQAVREAATRGQLKILFIAPEQLNNLDTWAFLGAMSIDLLVVDEAHCISTWGHDFRPSYRMIVKAVQTFSRKRPGLKVLGLTATADARVEEDIAQQLREEDGPALEVRRSSMDRPNISLHRITVNGSAHKLVFLDRLLNDQAGFGILYCATRDQTEIVAGYLRERGHDVISYHAGYDPEQKRALQRDFITGKHRVIAATNALGMGIDKPDIRFIVHVDVPGSITAYYQEVGRAGRDGQPSNGYLLFDLADRKIQEHFIHSAQPTADDFMAVMRSLVPDAEGVHPPQRTIKVRTGLHPTRVSVVLAELMEQEFIVKTKVAGKQVYQPTQKQGSADLSRYEQQNAVRHKELKAMLDYGEGQTGCLMATLRAALGDRDTYACGHCSQCKASPQPTLAENETRLAANWLDHRDVPIPAARMAKMNEGLAVLNGDHNRTGMFASFMRARAGDQSELHPELIDLVKSKLDKLARIYQIGAVLALPSRTWSQRQSSLDMVAQHLNVPCFEQMLTWKTQPQARQGTLLNNDQRRINVEKLMTLTGRLPDLHGRAVLLLDDYVGSQATLREATRALRKAGFKDEVVPFAIARVKWRLGAAGMI